MNTKTYDDMTHLYGKIWIWTAIVIILLVPVAICLYYNAWPPVQSVVKGLLGVAPIFWTVGVIEVITFCPMLGTAGSYLGFVTGNLTNLKVPCALNAMEINNVKSGTEEGEVVSTIAIATSSIVTTIIISIGVLLIGQLPILNSPELFLLLTIFCRPLRSGVYISKNWKISIAPLLFMIVLFF